MPIYIDKLVQPYTLEETVDYLQRQTDSFGLFLDLDRLAEYELHFKLQKEDARQKLLKALNFPKYNITENNVMMSLQRMGVPSYKFLNKYNEASFDKNVRAALLEDETLDEEIRLAVKYYSDYRNSSYLVSYLPQYTNLPICTTPSYNGHRMVIAHPKWNPLRTFRIQASEPSMQNIPRYMKDIITAPMGWNMLRCDSGQIEPRITYSWQIPDQLIANIITAYDDAYAGLMHYAELTAEQDAMLRADFSKFKKLELGDEFTEMRQAYKVLALSANYGSKHLGVSPEIAERYQRRIVEHPLRLKHEREVKEQVARGVESFKTAFGNTIYVEETSKYKRGTKAWTGHVERCGMNNGIQGTASELMLFSVNRAKEILTEYPECHIAFYKHDEGAFYVKEEQYNEVKPLLAEVTAYRVNGWIPINCDLEEGQLLSQEVPTVLC